MVERTSLLGDGVGPGHVQGWKHKVGSHNRGVQSPMARWAGEGKDWIKLVAQLLPRKEDVIRSLLGV